MAELSNDYHVFNDTDFLERNLTCIRKCYIVVLFINFTQTKSPDMILINHELIHKLCIYINTDGLQIPLRFVF